MESTNEIRLKNLQLALSMVGISVNIMTCDLIFSLGAKVDEKGGDFTLRDATDLAAAIEVKYKPSPVKVTPAPSDLMDKMPPHIKEMMEKGQMVAVPKDEKKESFYPQACSRDLLSDAEVVPPAE